MTLRSLLAPVLAVALAACDSGGPEVGRFESTLQTAPASQIVGTARFSQDRLVTPGTEIFLDGGRPVFWVRDPAGEIDGTGTFTLDASRDGVWMTYSADFLASPVAELAVVGTLRITRFGEAEVEGRFEGDVQAPSGSRTPVEGRFVATRRAD